MQIVLSGAERAKFRAVLVENEVPNIALNVTQFNLPKDTDATPLKEKLGTQANIYVYSSEGDEDTDKFNEFIRRYEDELTMVIGRPDYKGDWLGEKWVPLWNDDQDLERLAFLCERYGRVAISDKAINASTTRRIRQLKQRWGVKMVLLSSKVDVIESADWDVVIVASWTSVERYGETQVWDGRKLWRYAAQKKETARTKHRNDIINLGVDYEAILEGDIKELSRLAVKSWLAWGSSQFSAYQGPDQVDDEEEFDPETGEVATTSPESDNLPKPVSEGSGIAIAAPRKRHENEKKLLPVMGLKEVVSVTEGEEGSNTETVMAFAGDGVRQCDSCYLASRCPEFEPHATCAYELPIEIKTKTQLRAVMQAMVTMQASRIMFGKMAEDLEGQGADPALSQEMDRFFRMVKEMKDIEDTRDLLKVNVEARGGGSMLAQFFGQAAAEKAQEVSTPMSPKELDQFIIDAEVLD